MAIEYEMTLEPTQPHDGTCQQCPYYLEQNCWSLAFTTKLGSGSSGTVIRLCSQHLENLKALISGKAQ